MSIFGVVRDDNRDDLPCWDCHSIIQQLDKIDRVLRKPFIDLKNLPGLFSDNHDSLENLAEELARASVRIQCRMVIVAQSSLICESIDKIRSRIIEMKYQINRHVNNKQQEVQPVQLSAVSMPNNAAELTLPTELWVGVFSKLEDKERAKLRLVSKQFDRINSSFFDLSFLALYQQGYYSNSRATVKTVCDAFNYASDKNSFLFFKFTNTNSSKFRREFRQFLNGAVEEKQIISSI